MKARGLVFFGLAMVAAAFTGAACGNGGSGGSSSSSSGSGGSGTTSSSSSSASSSGTGGSMSTSSSTSTSSTSTSTSSGASSSSGNPAHGSCAPPCNAPADCCPPNTPGCPGDTYPNNYVCKQGACYDPQCATTADCTAQSPKLDCFSISGVHSCALACSMDSDCPVPLTCIGKDDNSKKYCLSMGSGCADDAACMGLGKCVNKVCVCTTDADCIKAGYTKCAL